VVVVEEFVVRVFKGGKVTVPKRLRELLGVEDGDYVRLALEQREARVGCSLVYHSELVEPKA